MPARLTLHPELRPTLRWAVFEDRSYVVGREPTCDLVVEDDRVSRRHARLACDERGWRLTDLASKNGVSVAGFATPEGRLEPGCWLSLGGVLGRFEALDEAAARADSARREQRWQVSAEHQNRLGALHDLPSLLGQVLASVLELSGGERGFVLLGGPGGFEVAAAAGLGLEELRRPEFAGSVGAVERALRERRSVAIADVASDLSLAARPSVLGGGIRALACVPLVALGRSLGALYTDSRTAGSSFEALDLELLEAFAGHAALALAAARLDAEIGRIAAELPRLAEPPRSPAAGPAWQEVVAAHAGAQP